MSPTPNDELERTVPQAAPSDVPSDLNKLALELFLAAVDMDTAITDEWKQATIEAIRGGLPGNTDGLQALVNLEVSA